MCTLTVLQGFYVFLRMFNYSIFYLMGDFYPFFELVHEVLSPLRIPGIRTFVQVGVNIRSFTFNFGITLW